MLLLLTGLLMVLSMPLPGQSALNQPYPEIRREAEQRYFPSDEIMNGEKYYYAYRTDDGTPFFEVTGDPPASVEIGGKTYQDQRIR